MHLIVNVASAFNEGQDRQRDVNVCVTGRKYSQATNVYSMDLSFGPHAFFFLFFLFFFFLLL